MRVPKFLPYNHWWKIISSWSDHRRSDNVISIKALKTVSVEILVVDNGRGMSVEKLAEIQAN